MAFGFEVMIFSNLFLCITISSSSYQSASSASASHHGHISSYICIFPAYVPFPSLPYGRSSPNLAGGKALYQLLDGWLALRCSRLGEPCGRDHSGFRHRKKKAAKSMGTHSRPPPLSFPMDRWRLGALPSCTPSGGLAWNPAEVSRALLCGLMAAE